MLSRIGVALLVAWVISLPKSVGAITTGLDNDGSCSCCRSNSTHIAWRQEDGGEQEPRQEQQRGGPLAVALATNSITASTKEYCQEALRINDSKLTMTKRQQRSLLLTVSVVCHWQDRNNAKKDAYQYLRSHVMTFDLPFLETLGFDDNDLNLTDGLDGGLIGPTIEYALRAKELFPYTDALPRHLWNEYVLSYVNLNEARSNWRPYLFNRLNPLLVTMYNNESSINTTVSDIPTAVKILNTQMWELLAPLGQERIHFVSSQTPLIFDTMSVLVYGYASCTGLAILFVNALRAVGIPARVAGTPAWQQMRDQGNHNWVEVYDNGQWYFLEPSAWEQPNGPVDTLDRDPCTRWFCSGSRFFMGPNSTRAYAARLESTDTFFRLAWEWTNMGIPADDQTAFYQSACSKCA